MKESTWIKACQQGDPQACRKLVAKFTSSFCAYFRGLGLSAELSEELVQETFLEIWRSLSSYRAESTLKAWVFVICRRTAWRHISHHKKHQHLGHEARTHLEEYTYASQQPIQEEKLWHQQRNQKLHQSIQSLSVNYREVLMLHYMEGLSYREMGHVLNISSGTAKSRIHKALRLLRIKLQHQLS